MSGMPSSLTGEPAAYARWHRSLLPEQREAADVHRAWWRSLPPLEKARLKGEGLDRAHFEHTGPVAYRDADEGSGDAAEMAEASHTPDVAALVDGRAGELAERFGCTMALARRIERWHEAEVERESRRYQAFLLQRVIGGFLKPGNLLLRAAGLAFAVDLAALNGLGRSIRDFAVARGFSPYGVSKVVEEWRVLLELPRGPHQKTEEARESYSRAQTEKHWRKKKC